MGQWCSQLDLGHRRGTLQESIVHQGRIAQLIFHSMRSPVQTADFMQCVRHSYSKNSVSKPVLPEWKGIRSSAVIPWLVQHQCHLPGALRPLFFVCIPCLLCLDLRLNQDLTWMATVFTFLLPRSYSDPKSLNTWHNTIHFHWMSCFCFCYFRILSSALTIGSS